MNTWWTVKKKGRDDIFSIGTVSSGSSGTIYTLYDSRGTRYEVNSDVLFRDYEEVAPDLTQFIPQLIHYATVDPEFKRILSPFAKRLDPDYFKVGDVVYFTNTSYFYPSKDNQDYFLLNRIGHDNPYTITKIEQDYKDDICFWVYLAKGSEIVNESFDFRLPMYMDRLVPGDVFNCLSRYNKPY